MATTLVDTVNPAAAQAAWSGFDNRYIGGASKHGSSGSPVKDLDPYSGETLLEIPAADRNDLNNAYESALRTQPGWEARAPGERSEIMRRAFPRDASQNGGPWGGG